MQKDFRVGAQKRSYLLQIENVVVEIILQLFVCIVNAELLKAVGLKILKAKNVQNTNGQTLQNKSKNHNKEMRRKEGTLTKFTEVTGLIVLTNDKLKF